MKLPFKFVFMCIIAYAMLSCEKEVIHTIENDFEVYVDRFFQIATEKKINLAYTKQDISVIMSDLEDPRYIGQCNLSSNIITIDSLHWKNLSSYERELYVFHELGHCVLRLDHDNTSSDKGECVSLMADGLDIDNFCSINYNSLIWRAYYANQLFDNSLELPFQQNGIQRDFQAEISRIMLIDTMVGGGVFKSDLGSLRNDYTIIIDYPIPIDKTELYNLIWNDHNIQTCVGCGESGILSIFVLDDNIYYTKKPNGITSIRYIIRKKNNIYEFYQNDRLMHVTDSITEETYKLFLFPVENVGQNRLRIFTF